MEKYLPWIDRAEGEVMPLWVKPDSIITATDMKWMMRDHFENTPYDMTHDIGAGPYSVPYRWRPMTFEVDGVEYTHERAIATQQTGFSFVGQLRSDLPAPLRGILWFGTDDANTCVYLPIFCSVKQAPAQLGHGDIQTLDWNANFWVNNWVANQAYNRYSQMIPDIRRVQSQLEDSIVADVKVAIEQIPEFNDDEIAAELTQDLANIWAERATTAYKQLGEFLFVKFMDGNRKKTDENNHFIKSEYGMPIYPEFPGYDERYFRSIVNDAGDRLKVQPINYNAK
jgi:dipeptidase